MKVSEMVLNSMKAVEGYNLPFETKMAEIERLQACYQKALELENKQALEWYNETYSYDIEQLENTKVETKTVKKVTKYQTYLNATLARMEQGLSLSEALEQTNRVEMTGVYIKTRRGYISKMKKHILAMNTTN